MSAAAISEDHSTGWLQHFSHAAHEVTHSVVHATEAAYEYALKSFERAHEYFAQLKTRQIQEHEMGKDNLRVARGGKVESYHDQGPLRPEPASMMGRLLKLFTRASAPAPEKS